MGREGEVGNGHIGIRGGGGCYDVKEISASEVLVAQGGRGAMA